MLSVKGALACIDELKHNGFEDNQAKVLAMAIDETVADRLNDVMSRIDARFDGIDARFDAVDARFDAVDAQFRAIEGRFAGIDAQFKGIDSKLEGINAKLDSRKYQIALLVAAFLATLPGICVATYVYLIKPLLG